MSTGQIGAEQAYAEAAEQLPLRAERRDQWSDRAVFWTAVRYGVSEVHPGAWPVAAARWSRLWEVARREHLPPIPGIPEVENMPATASVAERGIASVRAIVGKRR
ncbi:hypothetical protein CNE_1c11830 [Cupriavidus necator N-1]|uniref:Uncharacterized protein n=1 Tax=Cupriavidus necator (strain ATCC 43291 / DSM 13513 / CCUG 52238 / LMG 8453 / N-1) TaxID=1042878 RepID=G0ER20_CUPNN|nr:hypothetical protein [Cupriavidus necator]AEI76538.1 hypothetical protein CNE_1c11830 [Cupriavidus necator N-1]MDX6011341.1 hypothetical protein [Cupriavidus necator]